MRLAGGGDGVIAAPTGRRFGDGYGRGVGAYLSRHGPVAQAGFYLGHPVLLGHIELPDRIEEVSVYRGADGGLLGPPGRCAIRLEPAGLRPCRGAESAGVPRMERRQRER